MNAAALGRKFFALLAACFVAAAGMCGKLILHGAGDVAGKWTYERAFDPGPRVRIDPKIMARVQESIREAAERRRAREAQQERLVAENLDRFVAWLRDIETTVAPTLRKSAEQRLTAICRPLDDAASALFTGKPAPATESGRGK